MRLVVREVLEAPGSQTVMALPVDQGLPGVPDDEHAWVALPWVFSKGQRNYESTFDRMELMLTELKMKDDAVDVSQWHQGAMTQRIEC